jgi:putative acetyltransferase
MIRDCRLRPYRTDDADAVIALRDRAFAELARGAYSPEQIAALRINRRDSAYAEELAHNHLMLAFDAGLGLVAMAGWIAMPDDTTVGRVRKLAVHPALARRGLGRRMVDDAERRAREAGCRRLIVRSSLNAVPFYERLGYRVTAPASANIAGVTIPMTMMEKAEP